MRQGIVGGMVGAIVALGISLLAQSWTTPRTWVTGEVVSAGQFNTHVRDNLTYLYNALISLDASDTISGVFDVARIPDLDAGTITSGTFGQARLAADSVGTSQVRTAIGSTTGSQVTYADGRDGDLDPLIRYLYTLHDYAFMPSIACAQATNEDDLVGDVGLFHPYQEQGSGSAPTDTVGRFAMDGSCSTVRWRYLTSSDTPSIWVVIDTTTGDIDALWEAEDPIAVPPLMAEPGQRALDIGVPALMDLHTLYGQLTATQQTAVLETLRATVVTRRGWLARLTALSDLDGIEARYEPSGRLWALRALATAIDLSVGEYAATRLRVNPATDAWVVRTL